MSEPEQRVLWELVCAAVDAKGRPEFSERIAVIVKRWSPAYEFWLIRNRDRVRSTA